MTSATDPWIALAAMASATERVQLGPMVTPLARRRPWIVARQAVALDHLSGGRFVLGLGLGLDSSGGELSRFGEEVDDRRRAGMLDEGLAVLTGLLAGERVEHRGEHYSVEDVTFLPAPARPGGMPIWLAARWPNRRPVARALRHDGVFLIDTDDPADLAGIVADARALDRPFDVVVTGTRATTSPGGGTRGHVVAGRVRRLRGHGGGGRGGHRRRPTRLRAGTGARGRPRHAARPTAVGQSGRRRPGRSRCPTA